MTTETILKPIGNGQTTIPQDLRNVMVMGEFNEYKACFNNKIIIIIPIECYNAKKIKIDKSKLDNDILKNKMIFRRFI